MHPCAPPVITAHCWASHSKSKRVTATDGNRRSQINRVLSDDTAVAELLACYTLPPSSSLCDSLPPTLALVNVLQ
jgi:hypothetical protein